ncbi:hypothetical protein [Candidatus Marithrix sp. Canyon 246]|nr:hypothetical protein [Candidatus Marithrix sp. Canyon 246]
MFIRRTLCKRDGITVKYIVFEGKQDFREPDKLSNPSEELYKLTKKKYQKVAGSRAIAPHLKIDGTNKSHSFNILLQGIKKLIKD